MINEKKTCSTGRPGFSEHDVATAAGREAAKLLSKLRGARTVVRTYSCDRCGEVHFTLTGG